MLIADGTLAEHFALTVAIIDFAPERFGWLRTQRVVKDTAGGEGHKGWLL